MKHILKLFLLAVFLQSCGTTYYYSTISLADKPAKETKEKGFTVTKEDVSLTCFIDAEGGKFSVEIDNRTNEELFVDWKHSFLIAENRRTWDNRADTISIVCAYSYDGRRNLQFPRENTPAIWVEAQPRWVVPVHSSVSRTLNGMQFFRVLVAPDTLFDSQYKGKRVKQASFDIENSPLIFNAYLTLRSERSSTRIVFDNLFYVSDFLSSKSLPFDAMREELVQGNIYAYTNQKKQKDPIIGDKLSKELLDGAGYLTWELLKAMIFPKTY